MIRRFDHLPHLAVLELCLKEIDNCRPYFVNLLGERYGYVPKQIPQDLLQR